FCCRPRLWDIVVGYKKQETLSCISFSDSYGRDRGSLVQYSIKVTYHVTCSYIPGAPVSHAVTEVDDALGSFSKRDPL
ncbi:hypothetical protein J6590_099606, partial [Homalodisca vitripennis]